MAKNQKPRRAAPPAKKGERRSPVTAAELLLEIGVEELPSQLIAKLSFPKAMKWNNTGVRFARPVRWLVALYGGATLPIAAAGITAGNRTEGHRVLGSGKGVAVRDSEA